MYWIEKAPTGVTRCSGCKEKVELHDLRLTQFGSGWGANYWHKKCGLEYLEATMILLTEDIEGFVDGGTTPEALQNAGIIS